MPDPDGYPTKTELQAILDFEGTPEQLIKYINSIWWGDGFTVKNGRSSSMAGAIKRCFLSTWGWSGNEEIMGVLDQTWFRLLWWHQSNRGGHYIYEIPNDWYFRKYPEKMGLPHSKVDR